MAFLCDIVTPARKAFSEEVESVSVPTSRGTIMVLDHHIPLFTALVEGEVKIVAKGKEYFLAIGGGFMEVRKNGVSILVSRAFHAAELNEAEIKKAMDNAKDLIAKKARGDELTAALAIVERSRLELKLLRRRRSSPAPVRDQG